MFVLFYVKRWRTFLVQRYRNQYIYIYIYTYIYIRIEYLPPISGDIGFLFSRELTSIYQYLHCVIRVSHSCISLCVFFFFVCVFCLIIGKTFVIFGYANKEFQFDFVERIFSQSASMRYMPDSMFG